MCVTTVEHATTFVVLSSANVPRASREWCAGQISMIVSRDLASEIVFVKMGSIHSRATAMRTEMACFVNVSDLNSREKVCLCYPMHWMQDNTKFLVISGNG